VPKKKFNFLFFFVEASTIERREVEGVKMKTHTQKHTHTHKKKEGLVFLFFFGTDDDLHLQQKG